MIKQKPVTSEVIEKAPKTKDVEKLESIVNYISSFGDGAKGIAEVDSDKLGKNIDHYIRFVDNINSIEVQKIETATNMFKQMADFSNSIKGENVMEFQKLQEIIVDVLNVSAEDVTMETTFVDDLGADSLDTVELIMELEKEFNISIPDDQAEKIATVGDAITYIENNAK